jgi:glycosyltransferase involved in cell wall biosynthesis
LLNHQNILFNLVGTYSVSIFKDSKFSYFYEKALKKVKTILSISQYTADIFLQKTGFSAKVEVVTLGVDLKIFNSSSEQKIAKEMAFTFVGHLKERKGALFAIEAIKKLTYQYPELKLYIIGSTDSSYAQICKDKAQSLGLQNNVYFLGPKSQNEVAEYFKKSLANVLPSVNAKDGSFEGFGLIHLEANACSTLTIGSKNCGNESAIIDQKTGFLSEQQNAQDLAQNMKKIIQIHQNNEYENYARLCHQHAVKNSWGCYFSKVCQFY